MAVMAFCRGIMNDDTDGIVAACFALVGGGVAKWRAACSGVCCWRRWAFGVALCEGREGRSWFGCCCV